MIPKYKYADATSPSPRAPWRCVQEGQVVSGICRVRRVLCVRSERSEPTRDFGTVCREMAILRDRNSLPSC